MTTDQLSIHYALSLLGLPYIWGGDDPIKGFDCSGLCVEILQSRGALPHGSDYTAQGLYNHFQKTAVRLLRGEHGALCFYGASVNSITHIGYALDTYRMIEAGGGNSSTTDAEKAAKKNAYVRVRPIKYRKDLRVMLLPNYALLAYDYA